METFAFRPLATGEIVRLAFRLYGETLATSVSLALTAHLPLLLLSGMLAEGRPANPLPMLAVLAVALVMSAIVMTAITMAQLATLVGQPVGAWLALALAFRRSVPAVLLGYLLTNFVSHLGLLLLVIPGLAAGGLLAIAVPAIIVERKGAFAGMGRSVSMLGKDWLAGVAIFAFGVLMSEILPLLIITGLNLLAGEGPFSPLLAALLGSVAMPFALAANLLLYLSARARESGEASREALRAEIQKLSGEE
jgi:hypothetical protein